MIGLREMQARDSKTNPLRILLYLDSLHCGGAQRQLCHLASGLVNLDHTVTMAVYYPEYDHFRPLLEKYAVPLVELSKRSTWGMVRDLSSVIAREQSEWVISFLDGPCFYALLAKAWRRDFKLCVGERSASIDGKFTTRQRVVRELYRFADLVTTNSNFQTALLKQRFPAIASRIATIHNCVDDVHFDLPPPDHSLGGQNWNFDSDWLAVVGRIDPWKNLHGLIDALVQVRDHLGRIPKVRWAGRTNEAFADYVDEQRKRIISNDLSENLELIGNIDDVPSFLRASQGLIHPSTLEGFPNVVCEALAVGIPALIGDIADAKLLINHQRGMLFDPFSIDSMAAAIAKFVELPGTERNQMGIAAREWALQELRESTMVARYSDLLLGKPNHAARARTSSGRGA